MASSIPALGISVSFGRFENDSLSWEKWSSFLPNKYLEEVEKCATTGSVAKKKAYFEEHYKKIAARKAELQAQHKPMESKSLNSDDQNCGDLVGKSNGRCSDEGEKQETKLVIEVADEQNEEPEIATECQNSSVERVKEKIDSAVGSPMLNKPEDTVPDEAALVKQEVETLSKGSQDVKELPQKSEMGIEKTTKIKDKNIKLGHSKKSHKISSVDKERNGTRIKKKPASPVTKTPHFSTSRASKPSSTPTTSSASRTPSKTGNTLSYFLPKSKNPSVGKSKKLAPRSLHMSFSFRPSGSDPASLAAAATRKSLIMEKMGDKDIFKRAFKTFQSNYNQFKPSSQEQSPATKQVPAKGREPRFSTLIAPQKENGGSSRVSSMEKKNARMQRLLHLILA
ncbi:protein WVD2-like 7 [Durio zibethinus]|uniref:Protein WVD2-like 7 n=1 Tax=Durio zibethinus TaxID=66656 RepID=A0A6P5XD72_DURZI|nr:protein WVD2-like 7 [Durio zibethinus]XP_022726238.1 protein WVD2-like 7 [Durio zibethinus]XP_022726239.1 protein WVD2-like 7 [Durio zibethinus]